MADTTQQHTASVEEANAARLPLGFRDQCSAYVQPTSHTRSLGERWIRRKKCRGIEGGEEDDEGNEGTGRDRRG